MKKKKEDAVLKSERSVVKDILDPNTGKGQVYARKDKVDAKKKLGYKVIKDCGDLVLMSKPIEKVVKPKAKVPTKIKSKTTK